MNKQGLMKPLNRREVLRTLAAMGGLAALSSLLEACTKAGLLAPTDAPTQLTFPPVSQTLKSELSPAATPSTFKTPEETGTLSAPALPTAEAGISQVAFVKTRDRSEGVRQAIDLLGANVVVGKSVFLKPNFNSSDPTPGSTHPDVLSALVLKLKEMGAEAITVGDRSGMGDTRRVMSDLGVFDLGEKLEFKIMIFDTLSKEDWVMIQPTGSHWKNGFAIARPCLEADTLVQTCCLKTHQYGGHFTLSLKNSVGMVAKRIPDDDHDYMDELHFSRDQRRMIAEINSAYTPGLIVVDGVEAFISGGPDDGERVDSQVILAGTDRIAIDAAGVALLRYHGCKTSVAKGRIFEQEQIARAVELGLGADTPNKIEFLTPDGDSAAYAGEIKTVLSYG